MAQYPGSGIAATATEQIDKIAEIRKFEIQKLDAVAENDLKKFRTILEAYYADWMRLPSSMIELRKSGINENVRVSEGVQILYIREGSDPSAYQYALYSYHVSGDKVCVYKSNSADIEKVEKKAGILEQVAKTYRQREINGSVAFLVPR